MCKNISWYLFQLVTSNALSSCQTPRTVCNNNNTSISFSGHNALLSLFDMWPSVTISLNSSTCLFGIPTWVDLLSRSPLQPFHVHCQCLKPLQTTTSTTFTYVLHQDSPLCLSLRSSTDLAPVSLNGAPDSSGWNSSSPIKNSALNRTAPSITSRFGLQPVPLF